MTTELKKKRYYFINLLIISIMVFLFAIPASAQTNDDPVGAGSILRSGVDARAMGMGGAYVAVADNYSASYWNPAGITRAEPVYLGGMNYDKFGLGLNLNYLSGGISPSRWPLTQDLSLGGLSVPFIQDFSLAGTFIGFSANVPAADPDGNPIGEITYSERTFMGTTGFKAPVIGSLGGSLKYYRFRAPDAGVDGTTAKASGIGFDLGMLAEPLDNFYVGAAGFDISGTDIKWENTPTEPTNVAPARYSGGVAYDLDLSLFPIPEIVAGNSVFAGQYTTGPNVGNKDDNSNGGWGYEVSAGMEYRVSIFALRGGVTKPSKGNIEFSAGAGLKINLLSADVAWVQNRSVEAENTSDTVVLSTEFTF